jgi:DNA polymerase III subunit beta
VKFTAERGPFLAAVKRAASVIQPRRVIPPILGCVVVTATDTGLRIHASNMDEWVTCSCDAAVTATGSICLPAGQLFAWLAAAPKDSVVSLSVDGARAALIAGRMSASIVTLDAADFPMPDTQDRGVEVFGAIPAIATCLPFAATEEVRYYLCGVAINRGHIVSTDGHRACIVDVGADASVEAIIPTAGARQIALSGPAARLWIGQTRWACEDEGVVMGGKLIDGTFPDWTKVAAKDALPYATIDADAAVEAFSAIMMASDVRDRGTKMIGDGSEVILSCRGHAMDATVSIPCEGEPFEFGINAKYGVTAFGVFSGNVCDVVGDGNIMTIMSPAMPDTKVMQVGMRI